MICDIFVQDLPADAKTIEAILPDFKFWPFDPHLDTIAAIRNVVPAAKFNNYATPRSPHRDVACNVANGCRARLPSVS